MHVHSLLRVLTLPRSCAYQLCRATQPVLQTRAQALQLAELAASRDELELLDDVQRQAL